MTPKQGGRRNRRPPFRSMIAVVLLATTALATGRAAAQTDPAGSFSRSLTTNKGCDETGDAPVFAIGDMVTVSFRIASPSFPQANATLFDIVSNQTTAISFGTVATNRTFSFSAR